MRQGVAAVDDPVNSPGAVHPLVCTHPETGRRVLYLGRRRNAYILAASACRNPRRCWMRCGLTPTRDELTWYNAWRTGDLVLWDNRCTMHRRDPFDAGARRIMHRTQIKGEARPAA